jgi:hypothetical protein
MKKQKNKKSSRQKKAGTPFEARYSVMKIMKGGGGG